MWEIVCPRFKRKAARAINTELGTHIPYGSRSACIDPEGHTVTITVTVAWLLVSAVAVVVGLLLPAWVCASYDCLDL